MRFLKLKGFISKRTEWSVGVRTGPLVENLVPRVRWSPRHRTRFDTVIRVSRAVDDGLDRETSNRLSVAMPA